MWWIKSNAAPWYYIEGLSLHFTAIALNTVRRRDKAKPAQRVIPIVYAYVRLKVRKWNQ
jgi:hypothetical protein